MLVKEVGRRRPARFDPASVKLPPTGWRGRASRLDWRIAVAAIGLVAALAVVVVALLVDKGGEEWATNEPVDEALFGIAIAEFTVGGDLRRSDEGREVSRLL